METKILKLMVKIAHISQALDLLSTQLDEMYDILADDELMSYMKFTQTKLDKEDYD